MRRNSALLALLLLLAASAPLLAFNYMWLTDSETSINFPGDIQRFFGRDTLWGPVHSNDWIATQNVMGLPVFYSTITTARPHFHPTSPVPAGQFLGSRPEYNAPAVVFPDSLNYIREGAARQERFFAEPNMQWYAQLETEWAVLYYYPEGTPFDPGQAEFYSVELPIWQTTVLFIDGAVDIEGDLRADGTRLIIGASGPIRLMDNVIIAGTDLDTGQLPEDATSGIALASEQSIFVANTWENGRENRAQGADIVVTALLFAINGTIQFEDMNDVGDNYVCDCSPDERGVARITGGLTQRHRGYMHRSNMGGTGYARSYHYDQRLREWRVGVFEPFVDGEEWQDAAQPTSLPNSFSLTTYPNPFNAQTSIEISLPRAAYVTLTLYNIHGRAVRTIVERGLAAGTHVVNLSANDLPSGVYFASLKAEEYSTTHKLLLLK